MRWCEQQFLRQRTMVGVSDALHRSFAEGGRNARGVPGWLRLQSRHEVMVHAGHPRGARVRPHLQHPPPRAVCLGVRLHAHRHVMPHGRHLGQVLLMQHHRRAAYRVLCHTQPPPQTTQQRRGKEWSQRAAADDCGSIIPAVSHTNNQLPLSAAAPPAQQPPPQHSPDAEARTGRVCGSGVRM